MASKKMFLWPYEVALELGVCAETVRRWADSGEVEVIRDTKGRRHFRPEAVEALKAKLGLGESTAKPEEKANAALPK